MATRYGDFFTSCLVLICWIITLLTLWVRIDLAKPNNYRLSVWQQRLAGSFHRGQNTARIKYKEDEGKERPKLEELFPECESLQSERIDNEQPAS